MEKTVRSIDRDKRSLSNVLQQPLAAEQLGEKRG